MKIVAYIVLILLFLGLIGKVGDHEEAIKELQATSGAVAKVDLTKHTVFTIAKLEQEVDMLRLCVEDLLDVTNMNHSLDLLSWKVTDLEANTPARQYRLVNGTMVPEDYTPLMDDVDNLRKKVEELKERVKELEETNKYESTLNEWKFQNLEQGLNNATNKYPVLIPLTGDNDEEVPVTDNSDESSGYVD